MAKNLVTRLSSTRCLNPTMIFVQGSIIQSLAARIPNGDTVLIFVRMGIAPVHDSRTVDGNSSFKQIK